MPEMTIIEQGINEYYQTTVKGQRRGEQIRKWRVAFAYALKTVGAGGSLVVATGLLATWHQAIGISVLIAVFLDTITSNHKRLVAEVEAGSAFRSLRASVKGEFNREAAPLFKRVENGDVSAESELEALQSSTHKILQDEIKIIRANLEKADVAALQALSLDQERTSLSKD
ncbi:hypothetical protein [Pelagibius sp. Alg239-R121]|uniref:hypothetical protein n=1 Tax=Pelagibius sp. Alg239-R121 TaxID=2993448 RepID=UPI0024A6372B|nr:hypothetical protein [Pelagibius sp. Alg239-R121]